MMGLTLAALIFFSPFALQDQKAPRDTRKATEPFKHFIGKWRGTGLPEPGSKLEQHQQRCHRVR